MIQYFARANYRSGVFYSLLRIQLSSALTLYRMKAVSNRQMEEENTIAKSCCIPDTETAAYT